MAILETAMGYLNDFIRVWYAKILATVIILLLGIIIGRIVGKVMSKFLRGIELDSIFRKLTGMKIGLESKLAALSSYFVYFITVIVVLDELNVRTTVIKIIVYAIVIVAAISFLIAVKDFMPNTAAAFYIYRKKIAKEGDIVKVGSVKGTVEEINFMETRIRTKEGIVHIPNTTIVKSEVIRLKKKAK